MLGLPYGQPEFYTTASKIAYFANVMQGQVRPRQISSAIPQSRHICDFGTIYKFLELLTYLFSYVAR